MVKRYKGGLISATPPVTNGTNARSIWSLSDHLQGMGGSTSNWPIYTSFVLQTGTSSYSATQAGAVTHISEFESNALVYPMLPTQGYLKYLLKLGGTTETSVTVYFRKVSGSLIQSVFSLFGQNLVYVDGAVSTILSLPNDDMDSLFLDADGGGVLSRANTSFNFDTNTWSKYKGTTVISNNVAMDSLATYPFSSYTTATQSSTIVTFPGSNSAVWINLTSGTYKVNNGSITALPNTAASTIGTAAPTNSLWTISDGINSFLIGRYGTATAMYCKVDLRQCTFTATLVTYPGNVTQSNGTEEDSIGTQLFTVDGFTTYHKDKNFYYSGLYTWLDTTEAWSVGTSKAQFIAGPGSTQATLQTDMDIFGSIDTSDRSVWFSDWGHDDGGLYNVGNDTELGTRKTNIKLISTTYTN
jgi:hypothetical protein